MDECLSDRIGFLLKHAQARLAALSAPALSELGLSARHWVVISAIACEPGRSQQALSSQLLIDCSTMVGLIDALEQSGFVRRDHDPHDRRAHIIVLTASGERLVTRGRQLLGEAHAAFLAPLSSGERRALRDALAKLS